MKDELSQMKVFWKACEDGDLSKVKEVIGTIKDINKPNMNGWNAIILGAFNHHLEVVKLLLEHGADVNSTNANGTTVFMYAKTRVLENENYFFLDFLVQSGADINRRDLKSNWTVLDYAKKIGNTKLINYLVNQGAK